MSTTTLNTAQEQAVVASDGPLCIVAGPGTGKTKTLTARIAYLIQRQHVAPTSILALTFTNKAAREMQERVGAVLGDHVSAPQITTFHGLCYELLKDKEGDVAIISEADRMELLRSLRRSDATDITTRELSTRISHAKSRALDAGEENDQIKGLVATYNAALRSRNLYDFDDLLQQAYKQLRDDSDLRDATQRRWGHVLVDEFQDTNELQYQLLKLLANHENFFVIGDPLQSIYGFRGATGNIFERFISDFPAARRTTLTANYRSLPEIVGLANAIFPDAPKLEAQQKEQGSVQSVEVLNEYREAAWIVEAIERDFGGTDFQRSHLLSGVERQRSFSDYAVLYRTHHVARALKRAFAASGIPYQCVGDESPYLQKPLRTAIAVMRHFVLPDSVASPGDERLLKTVSKAHLTAVRELNMSQPTELLKGIIGVCQLDPDNSTQSRDLHQMLGTLVRLDDLSPLAFLERFDELAEQDFYDSTADAVTLMTIHASKGLEFGHVFLIAVEDGILPHTPKNVADLNVDEERRLLYVAATRAREQLTILYAKTRGGRPATPSPFITALTEAILPRAVDPGLVSQQRAQRRRATKNAQVGLF